MNSKIKLKKKLLDLKRCTHPIRFHILNNFYDYDHTTKKNVICVMLFVATKKLPR